MTAAWATATEFCSSVRDGTHDSPKAVASGRYLVTSKHMVSGRIDLGSAYQISQADFDKISARSRVDRWDVLISMIGTVGEACLVRDAPEFAIKNIGLFKSKGEREGRWLYNYLRSPQARAEIRRRQAGSTQSYISLTALRSFPIPIVPAEDMDRVNAILGSLDDKIELNRRMNETLEAMAQAIFRDWFVDFGPVRRKMEGAADPIAIMGGLTGSTEEAARLEATFPVSISSAGVPEGWSTERFDRFFKLERGLSYKGSALADSGKPLINLGCFSGAGGFNAAKLKFYVGDHKPRHTAASGTLLIANTDITQDRIILGSPHIVEASSDEQPLFSHHIYAARPLRGTPWERFFFYHLLEPRFRERAAGFATGTTVLALPKDAVEEAPFAIPPEAVLNAFLDLVRPLLDRARAARIENRTLAETRDYLLPRLMSGAVRVGDAQSQDAAA